MIYDNMILYHFLSSDDHSSNIYIFEEKETTDKSYVKTASNVPSYYC